LKIAGFLNRTGYPAFLLGERGEIKPRGFQYLNSRSFRRQRLKHNVYTARKPEGQVASLPMFSSEKHIHGFLTTEERGWRNGKGKKW